MNIDPKKIAKIISEDPDEVASDNHFDDTEDEYVDDPGFCDGCLRDSSYDLLSECQKCGYWWCEACISKGNFDWEEKNVRWPGVLPETSIVVVSSCPNCINNKTIPVKRPSSPLEGF